MVCCCCFCRWYSSRCSNCLVGAVLINFGVNIINIVDDLVDFDVNDVLNVIDFVAVAAIIVSVLDAFTVDVVVVIGSRGCLRCCW